jgi:hypothetical protein
VKLDLKRRANGATFPAMKRVSPLLALVALGLTGCLNVKTQPIVVQPIHITVDVNVKIDRALDDFFGDLDRKAKTL